MDTSVEESPSEAEENVRVVTVAPPLQWNVVIAPPPAPKGIIVLVLNQGNWTTQLPLMANDAITLGKQLRTLGKESNSGITPVKAALLGANGAPISVPVEIDDDDELPEEVA